jgi:hypothetical protein
VRIRSRKPCVLARRRLFGWKVRLLTVGLQNRRIHADELAKLDAAGRRVRPAVRTSRLHMLPSKCGGTTVYGTDRSRHGSNRVSSATESRKLTVFLRVPAKTRPSLLSSIIARC